MPTASTESTASTDPAASTDPDDREPVVVWGRRTAFCRSGGALSLVTADRLLAPVLSAIVADLGLDPAQIDDVIIGNAAGGGGNLARLAQCCNALAAQARAMGPSPEAGMVLAAAAQCNVIVQQAGPNGNAPELGALRSILAGRNVPAICAGF